MEFHFPSYTLHFRNSTICISPPIMEFQLSSLLQSLLFEIIIFNTPKSPIFLILIFLILISMINININILY